MIKGDFLVRLNCLIVKVSRKKYLRNYVKTKKIFVTLSDKTKPSQALITAKTGSKAVVVLGNTYKEVLNLF